MQCSVIFFFNLNEVNDTSIVGRHGDVVLDVTLADVFGRISVLPLSTRVNARLPGAHLPERFVSFARRNYIFCPKGLSHLPEGT